MYFADLKILVCTLIYTRKNRIEKEKNKTKKENNNRDILQKKSMILNNPDGF